MENSKSTIQTDLQTGILPQKSPTTLTQKIQKFYSTLNTNKGIEKPNSEEELPFTYKMYIKALEDISHTMFLYTLLTAIPIYFLALTNLTSAFDRENFFMKIFDFFITPNAMISKSKFYDFYQHTLSPFSIVFVIGLLCYKMAKVKEIFLENRESMENGKFGEIENFDFLKIFLIRKKKFKSLKELTIFTCKFLDMDVDRKCIQYHDTIEIDKKWKNFKEKNFDYLEKKSKNLKSNKSELESAKEEVTTALKNLKGDKSIFISPVNIIIFKSFKDSTNFYKEFREWQKSSKNPEIKKIQIYDYLNPYNINWSEFGKINTFLQKTNFFLFYFFMMILMPGVTFFLNYTLQRSIAAAFFEYDGEVQENEDRTSLILYRYRYLFLAIRVVLTSIYNLVLTFFIEKFFSTKNFSFEFLKQKSKFYFMNFFYLVNFIVADFYSILMSGIDNKKNSGEKINEKQIDVNSSFLYSTALKVAISLITAPYIYKLVKIFFPLKIPKLKEKLNCCMKKEGNVFLESKQLKTEFEEKIHDLGTSASFIIHLSFYLSFIYSFMNPFINLIVVGGMHLYTKIEKISLTKIHFLPFWINIDGILMIYKNVILGFLIVKFFSFGNSKLVVNYMGNVSLDNFTNLFFGIFDYTITVGLLVASAVFIRRYAYSKVTKSLRKKFNFEENLELDRGLEDLKRGNEGRVPEGGYEEVEKKVFGNRLERAFLENYPLRRMRKGEFDISNEFEISE